MSYILTNTAFNNLGNKKKRFREVLGDIIQQDELGIYCLIVPTGRRKRALERALIRDFYSVHSKPTQQLSCYTLESFVLYIFNTLYPGEQYAIISDAYRLLLFEKAASESSLSFFSGNNENLSIHTIEKCAELLYGVRMDGIDSQSLFADIQQAIENPENISSHSIKDPSRLKDLASILKIYESYIGNTILDYPAVLQLVIKKLQQDPSLCQQFGNILLDGFSEFRVPELTFLAAFAHSNTPCACYLEYSSDNQPMFGNLNETFELLQQAGFQSDTIQDAFSTPQSSLFSHLREWLFNTKQSKSYSGSEHLITVLESTTVHNEVDSIAKFIKWKHEKENIPLHEMVIATRNPEDYSGIFREILPLHGIPVNITDRPKLTHSPLVTAIFSILNLLIYQYQKKDIQKIFSSAYIRLPNTSAADMYRLSFDFELITRKERLKSEFSHYHSETYWLNQLQHIIAKYTHNVNVFHSQNDLIKVKEYEGLLASATRIYSAIETIQSLLPRAKAICSTKEFLGFIQITLQHFGILQTIEELPLQQEVLSEAFTSISMKEEIERDVRALKTFIDTVQELTFILEHSQTHTFLTFQDYCKRLQTTIRGAKFQVKEKHGTGITITSLEQIRELDFKLIIMCGMVDGRFPLHYTADTFMGKELKESEERHIRRERMQFYLALIHHSPIDFPRSYLFSYPTNSKNGEHLIRSQFVDAILKVTVENQTLCTISDTKKIAGKSDFLQAYTSHAEHIHYRLKNEDDENDNQSELKLMMTHAAYYWSAKGITERLANPLHDSPIKTISDHKVFSVTELDEYIDCGYKYFADRLLKLPSTETESNWFSSLERGNLYHSIFYRFYTLIQHEYTDSILPKVQLIPAKRNDYQEALHSIAVEELSYMYYDHPFMELEKRAMFGDINQGIKGTLSRWLDGEIDSQKDGLFPALFETSFGDKYKSSNQIPPIHITNQILLQGKIDRIDISLDNASFKIIDYKTGSSTISQKDVESGNKLQMPLYIKAAQNILEHQYNSIDPKAVNPTYYSLQEFKSKTAFKTNSDIEEKIQSILEKTDQEILKMKEGHFPVKPLNKASCTYCNYSSICRIYTKTPSLSEQFSEEIDSHL